MPTSYTSLLGLALPVTGELAGTWGDTVNDYLTKYLDAAVAGAQTISGSQTAVTLTTTNGATLVQAGSSATGSAQYQIINCTGNPASLLTITVPAQSKAYLVLNATSTSQSVKVVGAGPTTGVTMVSGEKALIAWDGSDFVKVASSVADGVTTFSAGTTGFTPSTATSGAVTLAGTLATTNGGTGLTSFTANGVLYASSSSALTTGSALTFDGSALYINGGASGIPITLNNNTGSNTNLAFSEGNTAKWYLRNITGNGGFSFYDVNAGSEGMRLTSTGLGIGTSSPASKLEVQEGGTGSSYGVISATATGGGNAGYGFKTGGTIRWWIDTIGSAGSESLRFYSSSASAERMRLDASGNLGIGTSSPVSTSGSLLTVYGAATIRAGYYLQWGAGGNYAITSDDSTYLRFITAGSERMRLDSSGNLGLGVTPSAWTSFSALQVGETGAIASNAFSSSNTQTFFSNNVYYDGSYKYIATGSAAAQYIQLGSEHRWNIAASGTAGNAISFTQAMTLDASGNLMVGTTTAVEKLTVAGGVKISGQTGNADVEGVLIDYQSSAAAGRFFAYNSGGSNMRFFTNASGGSVTERFRIASDGAWGLAGANYGTSGQVLTSNGSGSAPTWQTAGGGSAATPTALGTVYGLMNNPSFNAAIGYQAGNSVTSGYNLALLGYQAGLNVTSGGNISAVGASALLSNTTGYSNAAIGTSALRANTTGASNTGLGDQALYSNTTASNNTAVGYQAGYSNTTGSVTAFGQGSLYSNVTGDGNSAFGVAALTANTGNYNSAFGWRAGFGNTSGTQNLFVGYATGYGNTTGGNNTAIGNTALYTNTTGGSNTAVGLDALRANTTASYNTAIGRDAGRTNTTGLYNLFAGSQTGYFNTTGSYNSFVSGIDSSGYSAGYSNTSGSFSTAVGSGALSRNTTGSGDVAIGYQALYLANPAVSGYSGYNVAIGYQALYNAGSVAGNSTGNCVAIGSSALYSLSSAGNGAQCVAVGQNAGYYNLYGSANTFIGHNAGQGQNSGDQNTYVGALTGRQSSVGSGGSKLTAVGYGAGSNNSGNDNTFIGVVAGTSNTSGTDNVFVGTYAGRVSNTSSATYVGAQAGYNATTGDANVLIGWGAAYGLTTGQRNTIVGVAAAYGGYGSTSALTTGSYNVVVGHATLASSASVSNSILIAGSFNATDKGSSTGFINPNGGGVYQGNNSSSWSTTSDRRLKKNIVDNNEGLEKIAAIRVRNFEYRLPEEVDAELKPTDAIEKAGVQLGVIAQELQEVCPDCVKQETTGVLSVDSDNVFWHMVNAIKQLKSELDSVKAELATLKGN